ncbi:MAG TPA: hypothetical protein VI037_06670 [Nitrososphaera sp.]
MKKKTKNSVHVLVVSIVAVVVSTAFVVSLPTIASSAQEIKAANEFSGKKNNDHYQPISTQHGDLSSHIAYFAVDNDNLNQTKVTELRISLHDRWIEDIVWTRQYVVAAAAAT